MKHSAEDWRNGGFALYVHWPFCTSKCPYCDFNSHVSESVDHAAWRDALLGEITRWAGRTPGRVLNSIFFGGGTPSLMQPETVAAVIAAARDAWIPANDLEITLEANPGSVDSARFRDFAATGVNRVSLGVQALNDEALRLLGRRHDVAEALRAWDIANRHFERTSLDLIYARQYQTAEDWQAELSAALNLGPRHLSLYQLTIEDGTAFGDRHARGRLPGLPGEDRGADLWQITQDLCEAAGLPGYETSNHAAPGQESRHNLVYWRYGDYVGIGPGAHGRITEAGMRRATVSTRLPADWLRDLRDGRSPTAEDPISGPEQAAEMVLMGLRLAEGIELGRYRTLAGESLSDDSIAHLESLGLVWRRNGRLGATAAGKPLLNSVLRALL